MAKQGTGAGPGRLDYETPQWFADLVAERIGVPVWSIDLAAALHSTKAREYIGPDHVNEHWRDAFDFYRGRIASGSSAGYTRAAWLNPPYAQLERWVRLAGEWAAAGWIVAALLPGNNRDTDWYIDGVYGFNGARCAHEIIDVRGRIAFELLGEPMRGSSITNVVVVWRPGPSPFLPKLGVPIAAGRHHEIGIETRRRSARVQRHREQATCNT